MARDGGELLGEPPRGPRPLGRGKAQGDDVVDHHGRQRARDRADGAQDGVAQVAVPDVQIGRPRPHPSREKRPEPSAARAPGREPAHVALGDAARGGQPEREAPGKVDRPPRLLAGEPPRERG
ncbi:MAG: hypothetical protein MUF63_18305, partial [Rhodobacteraceae bacterium]|nr:hypothetical protein [Paracoccaceae bacterium]